MPHKPRPLTAFTLEGIKFWKKTGFPQACSQKHKFKLKMFLIFELAIHLVCSIKLEK